MHLRVSAAFLIGFGVFVACRPAQVALSPADEAAIRSTYDGWSRAARAKDLEAAALFLTPDNWTSQPNAEAIVGRTAVLEWVRGWPDNVLDQSWTIEEVTGQGDMAYSRAVLTETYTAADGHPVVEHIACLNIHRRQADGSWPFSRASCHATDPLPPRVPGSKS